MNTEHRITFTVSFDHPVKVWVLQLGGWLPIQFTPAQIILVDKNIKIALDRLSLEPDRDDMVAERWWLSQLNSECFKLNPMMCAYEGATGRSPSFSEFCDALECATETIAIGLPKARVIRQDPKTLPELFENVTAVAQRERQEIRFLCDVAPLLASRVATPRLGAVEAAIVDAAHSNGILPQSLPVLCALSCLYEPRSGAHPRIGRGVMKPTSSYSQFDAYNAISDLRAIEFLAMSIGLAIEPTGYCTRDKALAAFWTYLRVSAPTWRNNSFSATLSPAPDLFPRLAESEIPNLISRLR